MKNLNPIFSSLILVLYLSPLVQSLSGIGYFISNFDYIESELCLNKSKPAIKCHGTCVLAKLIKEKSRDHKPAQESLVNAENTWLFAFSQNSKLSLIVNQEIDKDIPKVKPHLYNLILSKSSFEPPEFLI